MNIQIVEPVRRRRWAGAALLGLPALVGCSAMPPVAVPVAVPVAAPPAQWAAPMPEEAAWPHEGRLGALVQWWSNFGGPDLAAFVEAAQAVSPSISSAAARLVQARTERLATGSALVPQFDVTAGVQRRSAMPPIPAGGVAQGGLQMSWELDVFGGVRAQRDAAQWRLQSADAAWHEARVSLAADVVLGVLSWRHCQATQGLVDRDAQAASRSAQLYRRLSDAGLQAPEAAAQAEAAAAQVRNLARSQAQRCTSDVKGLVQLTGWTEAQVRQRLATMAAADAGADVGDAAAANVGPRLFARAVRPDGNVLAMPAATLAQRPDVFMAAATVAAAAADMGAQYAARYPRVGLSGSIGRQHTPSVGASISLNTWSVGPLSLSLPVFDAGRRAAQEDSARARYDDSVQQHRAVVRRAVREVEEALAGLDTTAQQERDARLALDRARLVLTAVQERQQRGLASALQAEEALRAALGAESAWLDLQRNRIAAWVSLYRAAGGGWSPTSTAL